ncbi:MAG TPA: hypothetical protein VKQ71_17580 [Acidimicrobiales bacterium]|nr:hypothetical protein [Acidimicrobiales bacterium]
MTAEYRDLKAGAEHLGVCVRCGNVVADQAAHDRYHKAIALLFRAFNDHTARVVNRLSPITSTEGAAHL